MDKSDPEKLWVTKKVTLRIQRISYKLNMLY
jgi:hypothetical protein